MPLLSWMVPADLAAGDSKSLEVDFSGIELKRIPSRDDPWFSVAFQHLEEEFGAAHEVEQPEILASRLEWDPSSLRNDHFHLSYELILLVQDGEFVGVRDHSVVVDRRSSSVTIHMSHNLVAPQWRRSGIAGWLRALPLDAARRTLQILQLPPELPVVQVAEMEHADPSNRARSIRLTAYGKAGYRKVDPSRISYHQPDFRAFDEIDRTGGAAPLPLALLVRFPHQLDRSTIGGDEVGEIVNALYTMYGQNFRPADMDRARELNDLPDASERLRLVSPDDI